MAQSISNDNEGDGSGASSRYLGKRQSWYRQEDILMTNQGHKTLDGFPNESVAEITDVARAKIERMLLQKYGKSLVEFRVYRRGKFPYLVAAKLKDGTYKILALQ